MILVIVIIVLAVVLDQLTKLLLFGKELALLPGVVGIFSPDGLNTGMAWGLLSGRKGSVIILSCVTVLTLAALTYLLVHYRKTMPKLIKIAVAMVCGGALGNLIDRVFLGGVRDFINAEFIDFPIFNVADIFVTCGGILLGVALLFTKAGRGFAAEFLKDEDSGKKKADGRN